MKGGHCQLPLPLQCLFVTRSANANYDDGADYNDDDDADYNNDDDDDDGYPAQYHHDKIPPWREYSHH